PAAPQPRHLRARPGAGRQEAGPRGEVRHRRSPDHLHRAGPEAPQADRRAARLPRARTGAGRVAAVILTQAAAARQEARSLRVESSALRLAVRANLEAADRRSHRAEATADAGRRLRLSLFAPSPWSGLPWRRDDETLRTALVPLREL